MSTIRLYIVVFHENLYVIMFGFIFALDSCDSYEFGNSENIFSIHNQFRLVLFTLTMNFIQQNHFSISFLHLLLLMPSPFSTKSKKKNESFLIWFTISIATKFTCALFFANSCNKHHSHRRMNAVCKLIEFPKTFSRLNNNRINVDRNTSFLSILFRRNEAVRVIVGILFFHFFLLLHVRIVYTKLSII